MASLADLLPTSAYLLPYALPLFFFSLVLLFAGSFLTLQRTRSFAPRNDAMQLPGALGALKQRKFPRFYLEGGLGGAGVGYSFGVHMATFLALLIPNETMSSPLGTNAFVAVWVASCLPTAFFAGRFKYAAFTFAGITGGTSLALALSVAIHPPLLARRVIVALFASIMPCFTLLPFPHTQEASLRLAISAIGAFGFAVSVAILANVPAWSNIWSRLWVDTDIAWGTNAERGISAGFWLLLILGCATDWALKRYVGGNPDQKWDSYLAEYTTSLPHSDERAGTFRPNTTTLWDRITYPFTNHTSRPPLEPAYPISKDSKSPVFPLLPFSEKPTFEHNKPRLLVKPSERPIARLRALARETSGRTREAVKFRPVNGAMSSDDEDNGVAPLFPPVLRRQDTSHTQTSATKTLTNGSDTEFDYDKERTRLFGVKKGSVVSSESDAAPEYSDYEEDVTASAGKKRGAPGWTPPFIVRKQSSVADSSTIATTPSNPVPSGAVPLTPSLIHAIDRIAVAQSEAFGARSRHGLPPTGGDFTSITPGAGDESKGEHWGAFWRDVTTKASQSAR